MISAEGADGVDNLVDILQCFPVHKLVEFLDVGFDGCVVETAGFVIGIEQRLQGAFDSGGKTKLPFFQYCDKLLQIH